MLKKKICVVCFANYCRSPVAETVLTKAFKNKFDVISAGIRPLRGDDMDKRSRNYLLRKDYNPQTHIPRKLTREMVEESELILALDANVLMEVNRKYRKYMNKIKILTFQNNKIKLPDPFRFDDFEYEKVMEDIEKICTSLKL